MNDMFKKVNAKEKLIGWYHSGPKLRASDLEINDLFKRYTPNPLLVIVDVQPKDVGVPTDAYFAVEEIKDVCDTSPVYWITVAQVTNGCSGRYEHIKDLRPYPHHDRSRRVRRDWCRTSPTRHQGCRSWHPFHSHNLPAPVPARTAPPVTGHWQVPAKGG